VLPLDFRSDTRAIAHAALLLTRPQRKGQTITGLVVPEPPKTRGPSTTYAVLHGATNVALPASCRSLGPHWPNRGQLAAQPARACPQGPKRVSEGAPARACIGTTSAWRLAPRLPLSVSIACIAASSWARSVGGKIGRACGGPLFRAKHARPWLRAPTRRPGAHPLFERRIARGSVAPQREDASPTQEVFVKSHPEGSGPAPNHSRWTRPCAGTILQLEALRQHCAARHLQLRAGSRYVIDSAFERMRSIRKTDHAGMSNANRHTPLLRQK